MKTLATAIAVCTITVGLTAMQNPPVQQQPPTQQQQAPATPQEKTQPEVILTGCLVQGSAPTVFVIEKARKDPKDTKEVAVKYVVVASAEDLDLRGHVNHEVRITGTPDGRMAPPTTQKVDEKDLPRLSAKAVTKVADTCSSQVH